MGARGPIGKRSDQRHGHRTKAEMAGTTRADGAAVVSVPEPDPEWHEVAREWYSALGQSGQSQFYEPTDWQQARVLAHILDRLMRADRPSPELFKAWQSGAAELLTTEGARRRVRVELVRPQAEEKPRMGRSARDRLRAV